jgi:hypothetical protein
LPISDLTFWLIFYIFNKMNQLTLLKKVISLLRELNSLDFQCATRAYQKIIDLKHRYNNRVIIEKKNPKYRYTQYAQMLILKRFMSVESISKLTQTVKIEEFSGIKKVTILPL